ncbi:MAG TPA: hypothetical protein VFE10_10355 [Phenylobacterium sp.]|jgi:hypothetical protein|nr:hypothetical protein [Phenylobacterium sp.]
MAPIPQAPTSLGPLGRPLLCLAASFADDLNRSLRQSAAGRTALERVGRLEQARACLRMLAVMTLRHPRIRLDKLGEVAMSMSHLADRYRSAGDYRVAMRKPLDPLDVAEVGRLIPARNRHNATVCATLTAGEAAALDDAQREELELVEALLAGEPDAGIRYLTRFGDLVATTKP